jgi:hypothetical protein
MSLPPGTKGKKKLWPSVSSSLKALLISLPRS